MAAPLHPDVMAEMRRRYPDFSDEQIAKLWEAQSLNFSHAARDLARTSGREFRHAMQNIGRGVERVVHWRL